MRNFQPYPPMRNPRLLRFLAAVDQHALTGVRLTKTSGYDRIDLGLAVSTATRQGLLFTPDLPCGGFALTESGLRWCSEELLPFRDLIATGPARVAS